MPRVGSPDAPKFDGSPENLRNFLEDVRTTCAPFSPSDYFLIRFTIAYAYPGAPDDALYWQDIYQKSHFSYRDYIDFIAEMYPEVSFDGFFDAPASCTSPNVPPISESVPVASTTVEHQHIRLTASQKYPELAALHGPNADILLADECQFCDYRFNSEIPDLSSEETALSDFDSAFPDESSCISDVLPAEPEPSPMLPLAYTPAVEPPLLDFDSEISDLDSIDIPEVLMTSCTDLLGLEFQVNNAVDMSVEIPVLLDLESDAEDCANDPPLSPEFPELEGIVFTVQEVPRYPPGLPHIPCPWKRFSSGSLLDGIPDASLPLSALAQDLVRFDGSCGDLYSDALPSLTSSPWSPCNLLDSVCDDLPAEAIPVLQSSAPVIRNILDSECDDLSVLMHPVLPAVSVPSPVTRPPRSRKCRERRPLHPEISCPASDHSTVPSEPTHSHPPPVKQHSHALYPIQPPRRRRSGFCCRRRRRKRRWNKRRRRRPGPDDHTLPPPSL